MEILFFHLHQFDVFWHYRKAELSTIYYTYYCYGNIIAYFLISCSPNANAIKLQPWTDHYQLNFTKTKLNVCPKFFLFFLNISFSFFPVCGQLLYFRVFRILYILHGLSILSLVTFEVQTHVLKPLSTSKVHYETFLQVANKKQSYWCKKQ